MSAEMASGGALPAAGRDRIGLSALLYLAVLAVLMSAPAMARDVGQADSDLPCNDLCRAWMSWGPKRQPVTDRQPEPPRDETDQAVRPVSGSAALPPRHQAPMRTGQAGAAGRSKRLDARRLARDSDADTRKTAASPRIVPPRRLSALVSTQSEPVGAAAAGGSPDPRRPVVEVEPPGDRTADRLASEADAAVLARPLYQPPGIDDPPRDRSEAPERPTDTAAKPRATDPVTARGEVRGEDRDAADTRPTPPPAESRSEPRAVPPAAAVSTPDPSPPAPAGANPPTSTTRPPADTVAATPQWIAPVKLAPRPALPVSDLERLDEETLHEWPAASAPPTRPAHPTAGVILLGGLAVLSLVGVRRRPRGEPT